MTITDRLLFITIMSFIWVIKGSSIMFANKRAIQILYWLIIGILVILFVYLLVRLFPFYGSIFSFVWKLLSPFILACLIAYLLYPIIWELQEHKINKPIAILLIYVLLCG